MIDEIRFTELAKQFEAPGHFEVTRCPKGVKTVVKGMLSATGIIDGRCGGRTPKLVYVDGYGYCCPACAFRIRRHLLAVAEDSSMSVSPDEDGA